MEQQQSSFKEKERTDLREPQHFKVIIYKATRMAREENFPLRLTVAPEEE